MGTAAAPLFVALVAGITLVFNQQFCADFYLRAIIILPISKLFGGEIAQ